MPETLLKTLHLLSLFVWIGGMVFAHFFLRPSLVVLEPPQRLALMTAVLGRFFRAVTVAAPLAWLSGALLIGSAAKAVAATGGSLQMPLYWHLMAGGGTVMLALYAWIRLVPYRALLAAVGSGNLPAGAAALARVRMAVAVNLGLGTAIMLVTLLRWP
jgi:uncharacterized membrane protein